MCILFLTTNGNAKLGEYKLIVASNRDEFYNRPAKAATAWPDHDCVYGGIPILHVQLGFFFFFLFVCNVRC